MYKSPKITPAKQQCLVSALVMEQAAGSLIQAATNLKKKIPPKW